MCRSRDACTELYATVAGVGFVMRAKIEPAGRLTREMERLANEPGLRSTRRRRVRSGWTQAGMMELEALGRMVGGVVVDFEEDFWVPFEADVGVGVMAAEGDMVTLDGKDWSLCVYC
jgi:hypothetical protein